MVFAIVRNPEGSVYLQVAAADLDNIHIISGDVGDYDSLEASPRSLRCEFVFS